MFKFFDRFVFHNHEVMSWYYNFKYNYLIISLLGLFFFFLSVPDTGAQTARSGKFEDKDIENFIPVYQVEEPEAPVIVKSANGKLPENNSPERVKFLMDSIYKANGKVKYMEGFRVQVYSGTDREEANRVKENIYKALPDADIYSVYKQPVYRVRLGDYTERLEAIRVLSKKLAKQYPNAIVVPDYILIKRK